MGQARAARPRSGTRLIGPLTLASEVLAAAGDGQRLLIYQAPPGTPEHDALVLLAMTTEDARTQ